MNKPRLGRRFATEKHSYYCADREFKLLLAAVFVCLLFFSNSCRRSMQSTANPEKTIRICFTGDVMLSRGVKNIIVKKGKDFLFDSLRDVLSQYDYKFINLECPITKFTYPPDKPFSFRADSDYVGILTAARITHATLANNHIDDQRIEGAADTYNFLIANRIVPIGLKGKTDTICRPAEINLGRRKLAVFGALGIEMNLSNIWFCYDSLFVKSVEEYKRANPAAFVICYLHWGIEYLKHPSNDQVIIAHELIDRGADMIIGHHPHVIESIQSYKGKPILYSLGNLIFDQHDEDAKKGIFAGLTFRDSIVETEIVPYNIKQFRPELLPPEEKPGFKKSLLKISNGISLIDSDKGWKLIESRPTEVATK